MMQKVSQTADQLIIVSPAPSKTAYKAFVIFDRLIEQ